MNRQFDIIIVGDSKEGNAAIKNIAADNKSIKIAFISRDFKNTTTRDFLNVEYIKDEVVFTDYKNRLFCCYLKSGERQYCTHLIIASGLSYAPLMARNKAIPGVLNTVNEIPKTAKQQVAVIVGNTETDAKFALNLAKKYKYVYLCANTVDIDVTEGTRKKMSDAENLLLIQNVSIAEATFNEGSLTAVKLDNYSSITCNAIFAKTEATPEVAFVSEKLISRDNESYLVVTDCSQSLLVPKCYAIGNCVGKSTKKMQAAMITDILNDF